MYPFTGYPRVTGSDLDALIEGSLQDLASSQVRGTREWTHFDVLIKAETRKFQGLTARSGARVNCEPIRADDDRSFARMYANEIGEMTLLATITDHTEGLATPALYRIEVQIILTSTVDEPEAFAGQLTYLRSYLGAYTGAFRQGDTVYLSGKLVHLQDSDHGAFGIELTPWNVSKSYLATLTG